MLIILLLQIHQLLELYELHYYVHLKLIHTNYCFYS